MHLSKSRCASMFCWFQLKSISVKQVMKKMGESIIVSKKIHYCYYILINLCNYLWLLSLPKPVEAGEGRACSSTWRLINPPTP